MSQKWGFFDGIRVCRVSGGQLLILINFFGPFNLALDGFMAAPSLISHHSESALWNSGKVMEAGVCSLQEMGDMERLLCPRAPQSPIQFH